MSADDYSDLPPAPVPSLPFACRPRPEAWRLVTVVQPCGCWEERDGERVYSYGRCDLHRLKAALAGAR